MVEKIKNTIQIKFVSDSLLTIISHVLVGISALIINTIVAVKYGSNGLGIFSQGLSVYMLISLLSSFGIQISVQKHASQYGDDNLQLNEIFINSIYAVIVMSAFTVSIFYLFLKYFPNAFPNPEVYSFIKIICIATPLFAINKTMNGFFVGLRAMKTYASIRLIRWLALVGGITYLSSSQFKLNAIGKLFIGIEGLLFIILLFMTVRYWGTFSWHWIKSHIIFGTKNILAGFVGDFATRVPILIIGYISGNEASGLFAYALTFARSILMIPQALQKSFNPIFTKNWYENNVEKIHENIFKVFKVCIYTIFPAFFLLFIFFQVYTMYFMPPEYLQLSSIMLILFIGSGSIFLFGPFSTLLIMTGHLYTNLIRVVLFSILNLIFTFSLGYTFGNLGVAIAVSLSMIINIFMLDYFYKKKLNIPLFQMTFGKLLS